MAKISDVKCKKLSIEYSKFGLPKKLLLTGLSIGEADAICQGASMSRDRRIRYPLEEMYARRLVRCVPDLIVSPEVFRWLDECVENFKKQASLLAREDIDVDYENSSLLFPFQRVDVEFHLNAKRYINGNKMGTGKTIESIALMNAIEAQKVLILVTKTKMKDWKDEILKWSSLYKEDDIMILSGTPKQKQALLQQDSKVIITTHATMRNCVNKVRDRSVIDYGIYTDLFMTYYDAVFVDEAHKFRNFKTKQSLGLSKIKSKYMSLITGSIITSSPKNLWSLLHILYPERFTSYWQFINWFCNIEVTPYGDKPSGIKNEKVLQYILAPFTTRRLKEEVMSYLPNKIYKKRLIPMEAGQRKMYESMEKDMVVDLDDGEEFCASSILSRDLRLRQLALCPKLIDPSADYGPKTEAVLDIIEECTDEEDRSILKDKIVIFSYFSTYLDILGTLLDELGLKYAKITGSVDESGREKAKDAFHNDPTCGIMLCTMGAGGEGTNLQNASVLIFTDYDWSPDIMEQCEDRLHRYGQVKNPLIISLIAENSIDEHLVEVVQNKAEVIDRALAIRYFVEKVLMIKYKTKL